VCEFVDVDSVIRATMWLIGEGVAVRYRFGGCVDREIARLWRVGTGLVLRQSGLGVQDSACYEVRKDVGGGGCVCCTARHELVSWAIISV
jgi:hypothetical protein